MKILDVNDKGHELMTTAAAFHSEKGEHRVLQRLAAQLCDVRELGVRG